MEIKFCRRCGAPLQDKGRGAFLCQKGHRRFYKSQVAANILLLNERGELLVGVRANDPGKGYWDVPGGFCDYDEDFNHAIVREAEEELGLKSSDYSEPQYLMNGIDYYHWEGEDEPVINIIFWARLKGSPAVKAADDITELMWVPLKQVDLNKFASTFVSIKKAIPMLQKLVD